MTIPLSQWEAFMVETLRHNGVSGEDIIKGLQENDVTRFQSYDTTFDYEDLHVSWTDDSERIEKAITDGYQVKFLSVYGIKRLLKLMFSLEEPADYTLEEQQFVQVPLTNQQATTVRTLLSPNWSITDVSEVDDKQMLTITHATAIKS